MAANKSQQIKWEGWEGSIEAEERDLPEGVEGVMWFDTVPAEGLAAVDGGIEVITPSGRRVILGIRPGTVSNDQLISLGLAADKVLENIDNLRENSDIEDRGAWGKVLIDAVIGFKQGTDKETLWKLTAIMLDYERCIHKSEEKGYNPEKWTLREVIDLVPVNDDPGKEDGNVEPG